MSLAGIFGIPSMYVEKVDMICDLCRSLTNNAAGRLNSDDSLGRRDTCA